MCSIYRPLLVAFRVRAEMAEPESREGGEAARENGQVDAEGALQKLLKDSREMRENLRLERSRNAGPEGELGSE